MPTISRTFSVSTQPDVVLDYLEDFARTEEWDPGTVRCWLTSEGPIAVGSTWHNESRFFGISTELDYTLTTRTDDRVVFEGRNKSARTTDDLTVAAEGTGSRVTYRAIIEMERAAVLTAPIMRLLFEWIAGKTVRQLSAALEKRGSAA